MGAPQEIKIAGLENQASRLWLPDGSVEAYSRIPINEYFLLLHHLAYRHTVTFSRKKPAELQNFLTNNEVFPRLLLTDGNVEMYPDDTGNMQLVVSDNSSYVAAAGFPQIREGRSFLTSFMRTTLSDETLYELVAAANSFYNRQKNPGSQARITLLHSSYLDVRVAQTMPAAQV